MRELRVFRTNLQICVSGDYLLGVGLFRLFVRRSFVRRSFVRRSLVCFLRMRRLFRVFAFFTLRVFTCLFFCAGVLVAFPRILGGVRRVVICERLVGGVFFFPSCDQTKKPIPPIAMATNTIKKRNCPRRELPRLAAPGGGWTMRFFPVGLSVRTGGLIVGMPLACVLLLLRRVRTEPVCLLGRCGSDE